MLHLALVRLLSKPQFADGKNGPFPACAEQCLKTQLFTASTQQTLHASTRLPPARLLQARSPASQRVPSQAGLGRESREQRHKGPFVPVARARLYLLSLGKQEVPGGHSVMTT